MPGALTPLDLTPLRWEDRWLDDGSDLELRADDEQDGLRLHVTTAGELIASRLRGPTSGRARIKLDPSNHDLLVEDPQGVLGPPLDLEWLQRRLDPALREAISERARRARSDDHHDWKEGDKPRVSLGAHVRFCDVFPASWDLLVTHGGKRYALLDRYRVDEEADEVPIAIEVIDVVAGASVGTAKVRQDHASDPGKRVWRPTTGLVDKILSQFRQDADDWSRLLSRPEAIARVARRLRTWDADRADPEDAVRAALSEADDPSADAADRVAALGSRAVPALRRALQAEDPSEQYFAAQLLAEVGDASGVQVLVAALLTDDEDFDCFAIIDNLLTLGERSLEPLLTAFPQADPERRFLVMEALVALEIRDDRIRDLLLGALDTDATVAGLLAQYGDDGAPTVAALRGALVRRLDQLELDSGDLGAYDDAIELADALRDLEALSPPLAARVDDELLRSRFADRPVREPDLDDLDDMSDLGALDDAHPLAEPAPVGSPVRAVARPGRNEPCWCGSKQKYKKCHLDSDEAERLGRP
ncbi:MAG TPA: SEC-C domain-containing protein [Kofleriaceae bacterium]